MDFVRARENLVQRMDRELSLPEAVKKAFLAVPREEFVPVHERDAAYVDTALSIGHGATISQPSMLAIMLIELMLEPGMSVLEAGAGCGYFLALLSAMGTH